MEYIGSSEMNQMLVDFQNILLAPESCDIVISYKVPNGTVTVDPVYGTTIASSWTDEVISTRAMQHIVKPRQVQILDWGILEVGDCIFYIDTKVDLTVAGEFENVVITSNGISWLPITRKMKAFYNYLIMRFGNGQIGQVIPCKLQQ